MFGPALFLSLLSPAAQAGEVTTENCGALWEAYFNRGLGPAESSKPRSAFEVADKIASFGKKKRPEVVVASCTAGEPDSSTITTWNGQQIVDQQGRPVVTATCTKVDVVEVQGKKRDRCRRFPTSRICYSVNDETKYEVAVGSSSEVSCPAG